MRAFEIIKGWFHQQAPASLKPPPPDGGSKPEFVDSIFRYPVRKVARELRYRHLGDLVDAKVTGQSRESADADFLAVVGHYLDQEKMEAPLIRFGNGVYRRYGNLDMYLPGKREILTESTKSGVPLLVALGLVSREDDGAFLCEDVLEWIAQDIERVETHLRLFLVDEAIEARVRETSDKAVAEPRDSYAPQFPVSFRIVDACLSNSPWVWQWKHYYWLIGSHSLIRMSFETQSREQTNTVAAASQKLI